jgi:hypothetical protein
MARRLITVPYYRAPPIALIGIPAPTLAASGASSSSINLTASYTGPPNLATYTFWQWDPQHEAWNQIATQAGAQLAVNGLSASTVYQFMVMANTAESPSRSSQPAFSQTSTLSGNHIKWNPGHYAASGSFFRSQSDWTGGKNIKGEIDMVLGDMTANVLGYLSQIPWNAIENNTLGVYDFSLVDEVRTYIQNTYPGKRMALSIPTSVFGTAPVAPSLTPNYILNDSQYGYGYPWQWYTASPGCVAQGSINFGWWPLPNGACTAWWITPVANRLKALYAALAAHVNPDAWNAGAQYTYDTDPYFEAITTCTETATSLYTDTCGHSPIWNESSSEAAWKGIISSMVSSFPNTNVMDQNNFMGYTGTLTSTCQVGLVDMQARAAASGPDVFGLQNWTWGQQGYMGLAPGFTSQWQQYPYMGWVQGPDYGRYGATNQNVADAGLRNPTQSPPGLGCSHMFWSVGYTTQGLWSNVSPVIAANPMPAANKVYPSGYP